MVLGAGVYHLCYPYVLKVSGVSETYGMDVLDTSGEGQEPNTRVFNSRNEYRGKPGKRFPGGAADQV